jgi:hypothetical protein
MFRVDAAAATTEAALFAQMRQWQAETRADEARRLGAQLAQMIQQDCAHWRRSCPRSPVAGQPCTRECAMRRWIRPVPTRAPGAEVFGCLAHLNTHHCTRSGCPAVAVTAAGHTCIFSGFFLEGDCIRKTNGFRVLDDDADDAEGDGETVGEADEPHSPPPPGLAREPEREYAAPVPAPRPRPHAASVAPDGDVVVRRVLGKLFDRAARAVVLERVTQACRQTATRELRARFSRAGRDTVRRMRAGGRSWHQHARSDTIMDAWPTRPELVAIVFEAMEPVDRFRPCGRTAPDATAVAPRGLPYEARWYIIHGVLRMYRVAVAAGWIPRSVTALEALAAYVAMALATRGAGLCAGTATVWAPPRFALCEGLALAWAPFLDHEAFFPVTADSVRNGKRLFRAIVDRCPPERLGEIAVGPFAAHTKYSARVL